MTLSADVQVNNSPFAKRKTVVQGLRHPLVIFANYPQARIPGESVKNCRKVSAGTIIDYNQLDFFVRLAQDTLYRLLEKPSLVPDRQDDAHERPIGGIAPEAG